MSWFPTALKGVFYGTGSVKRLDKAFQFVPGSATEPKAFIVTGRTLHDKTPIIKDIKKQLGAAHVGTTQGYETALKDIREALEQVKEAKANVLIGVGGGSPIDAAKVISRLYAQDAGGKASLRQIAIPTTLSAAEFSQTAGFTNEQGHKTTYAGKDLAPRFVILDTELTLTTPQRLWLSSGLRALDHATECLYRKKAQPPLKHLAIGSIHDLFTYLPRCKNDETDLVARERLMTAAWQSLWPNRLTTPLGMSHLLGHHLGATYKIPHGMCSALTMAPTVSALLEADVLSEDDLGWLARAYDSLPREFSKGSPASTIGAPTGTADKAKAYADAIDQLVGTLGLKTTLQEYEVPPADFDEIASSVHAALKKADATANLEPTAIVSSVLQRIQG